MKGYDYSQAGLYFITICIQDRESLLGKIENGKMILNDAGKMVQTEWDALTERFNNIELAEFVVMPNHFHAILEIVGSPLEIGATTRVAPTIDATNKTVPNDTIAADDLPVGAPLVGALNDQQSTRDTIVLNDLPAEGATTRVAPTINATNKTVPNDTIAADDLPVGASLVGALNGQSAPADKPSVI